MKNFHFKKYLVYLSSQNIYAYLQNKYVRVNIYNFKGDLVN